MENSGWLNSFLMASCIALGVAVILCMLRAAKGPRFTDRIVAVNMTGTITIVIMSILSVYFRQDFLVDIAIVYALLSFIAVVVLTRLVIVRRRAHEQQEREEAARRQKEAERNDR